MATIDRLCTYPVFNAHFRKPGGQDTIKRFIKDFDTLMRDAGLVRTALENQLDVDNIDDLNIDLCFTNVTGSCWNYNNDQAVYYAPLEYGFNDSLQASSPVTLKFEFFYFRYNYRSSVNPNDVPYFGCKITVSNNMSTQVIWQHPWITKNWYANHDWNWPIHDLRSVFNEKKSNICYEKDKGYLFLNLCPDYRYNISGADIAGPTFPIIMMCVGRSKDMNGNITSDYIRLIHRWHYTNTQNTTSNSWAYGSSNFRATSDRSALSSYVLSGRPSVDIYESNIQFQVPYNASTYYNQGNYYTYMTPIYDTNNKIPVYDPFILIGNKIMGGYETASIYNIKLNDNETKKYLAISQTDISGYPYHSNQCILVYYN